MMLTVIREAFMRHRILIALLLPALMFQVCYGLMVMVPVLLAWFWPVVTDHDDIDLELKLLLS